MVCKMLNTFDVKEFLLLLLREVDDLKFVIHEDQRRGNQSYLAMAQEITLSSSSTKYSLLFFHILFHTSLIFFLLYSQPKFLFYLLSRISVSYVSSLVSTRLLDSYFSLYSFTSLNGHFSNCRVPISLLSAEKFPFPFHLFSITMSSRYLASHFAQGFLTTDMLGNSFFSS